MQAHNAQSPRMGRRPYLRLLLMAVLSFMSMYVLMYAMVSTFGNVFSNFNQAYMAALMTAPMVVFELALMGAMYAKKKWNLAIVAVSILVLLGSFFFIRQQTAIGDSQFLRSMIPHHSAAILMCDQATITDPELKALCEQISTSQQQEIDQMQAIMARLSPAALPRAPVIAMAVLVVVITGAAFVLDFRRSREHPGMGE